jgi:VWFA-related protein
MRYRSVVLPAAGLGVLAWFFFSASGVAQDQAQRVPRQDAAAVVKLVPVRVLDAGGRPVRGLSKADFTLRDNGELMTITEFEIHESGESRISDLSRAVDLAAIPARQESKRRYFFVLDMQATDLCGNRDAKKAVLEFVENHLLPGDEACVMTFGALTGLVLRQYLTSDQEKVKLALSRSIEMGSGGMVVAGGGSGGAAARDEGINKYGIGGTGELSTGSGAAARTGDSSAVGVAGAKATLPRRNPNSSADLFEEGGGIELDTAGGGWLGRAARTKADFASSMSELAKAMKFVPGSKHVVYFSTRTPGKAVGQLFAEANTTIYAVNTNSIPDRGGGAGAGQARAMKKLQGEALKEFAEASGGVYFADLKDAKTIARDVEALSGNYYVLGYYINPSWDGRLHQIQVTVRQPELRVLYQSGYSDPKPFILLSELEKKLQLFDLLLSDTPVSTEALDLPVCVLLGSAMKEANAAVLLKLVVGEKTGLPPGRTELFTFIFDKERKIVLAERGELDSTPLVEKAVFPYLLTAIQPGEYEIRVMARHMETGESAASRLRFAVPDRGPAARMSLGAPFLLVPGSKPEFVRMSRSKKKEGEPATIVRFCPCLPRNCAPLVGGLPPDADVVWALLPLECGPEDITGAQLDVRQVRADDGTEVPVDWRIVDTPRTEGGTTFILVGMSVAGLAPGAYRLEFSLKDETLGTVTSATASLTKR